MADDRDHIGRRFRVKTPVRGVPISDDYGLEEVTKPPTFEDEELQRLVTALWQHVDHVHRRSADRIIELAALRPPDEQIHVHIKEIHVHLEKHKETIDQIRIVIGQLDGINDRDPGRVGRLEERMLTLEKKHETVEKITNSIAIKVSIAAAVGGIIVTILLKFMDKLL